MEAADRAWRVVLVWFLIAVLLLAAAGVWSVVFFAITFGAGFGGAAYLLRKRFREKLPGSMRGFAGYMLVAMGVTVFEEWYCYILGNRIAYPVLHLDLILVGSSWSVWFAVWYLYLSKRFHYTEKEALLTSATIGVLYEAVGGGRLADPLTYLIGIPVTIVVYAAIFVLPLQLIDLRGTDDSLLKYPVAVLLPYILSIPVVVLVYMLFL